MRITLSISIPEVEEQELLSLDIFPDMTLETLRSSIQAETRIHPFAQHIYHNGRLITDDSKTMEQLQIGDGEMLALHVRDMRGTTGIPPPAAAAAAAPRGQQADRRGPGASEPDPELVRLQILGNPGLRAETERHRPQLAAALENQQLFAELFRESYDRDRRERVERHREIAELNADYSPEAQAKIEEMIRQEQVLQNLQSAMEYTPEVFGRVHMLYVDVEVNKHRVKALVDSGAQATIMSPACAEACNIMRLVDKRFSGVARGVGTARIIGRVHSAQIKIGSLFLPCSLTVMEGKQVELILGLDMLKRHQACVDLAMDRLVIQGVEVPFLGEADIPKETEEALEGEPTFAGPGGMTIGQRSGAVSAPAGAPSAQPSQPAAAEGAASPAPAAPPARPSFPNEAVDQLMALGFSRDAVINALRATGGNVEFAANMLLQG